MKNTSQQAVFVSQKGEHVSETGTDLLEMPWNPDVEKRAKPRGSNGGANHRPHSIGFGASITVENAKRMQALRYRTSPARLRKSDEKQLEFHWQ